MKDKQNRNLVITVVVLVILNLITIFLLWMGKPNHEINDRISGDDKIRISEMLKKELGFDDKQINKFLELRANHHKKSDKINKELMLIKKQMFDEAMYKDNGVISDSLLNLSLKKQAELEKITFEHFVKLKQICTPEQQEKLFELVERLIGPRKNEGPPPVGPKDKFRDGMPPPPGRDGPPRRN